MAHEIDLGIFEWPEQVRHLTAHTAESALVGLDFPATLTARLHKHTLTRNDLALSTVTTNWPMMLEAVRYATRRLARQAVRDLWDERSFHAAMNP